MASELNLNFREIPRFRKKTQNNLGTDFPILLFRFPVIIIFYDNFYFMVLFHTLYSQKFS
jgi:hypothetical protein